MEYVQPLEATGVSSEQAARVPEVSSQQETLPLAMLTWGFLNFF